MKKLFYLLIVAAMVLALGMPATAAEYVGHQECCENCDKCDLGTIDCPDTKIGNETSDCDTDYFDYDGLAYDQTANAIGYGLSYNNNCKVIFDICCCDADAIAYFTEDQTIGVRMTNLTEGFYFTGDTIWVEMFSPDDSSLCDNTTMYAPQEFTGEYSYRDAAGDSVDHAVKANNQPCEDYPDDERAVVVETPRGEGIQITAAMIANNQCKWWFDMPAQAYDAELAEPGARVNVKIELLTAVDGLCGEWKTICECIVDLGLYCVGSDEECNMFPYVLTQTNGWATGITVVNTREDLVHYSDMKARLEIRDKLGNTYTYEKNSFASDEYHWSFALDSLLPGFDGMPAPGPALLRVYTNFKMEGYKFLTNGSYAGGTEEEGCDWGNVLSISIE